MPAKRKKELIDGQFFKWIVGQRDGVYYADGRSNPINVGRHSLGTRDRGEALKQLERLDRVQAVKHGKAERSTLEDIELPLSLEEGRKLYEAHIRRPRVLKGVKKATDKRYRAVLDKFLPFANSIGIRSWNLVDTNLLKKYAAYLEDNAYAYATQYLELTSLKQILKWLKQEGHLKGGHAIHLPLSKPKGTSTYCWRPEEVKAMNDLCSEQPDLFWLQAVIIGLACTGLRISELAALRWSDIDLAANLIRLTDESTLGRGATRGKRETKTGRSRALPINGELSVVLQKLKKTEDGLVFHGPMGGKIKPDTVRNILIRDVIEPLKKRFPTPPEGIGFTDGRLHSFRHYFCSRCATSRGVTEQVIMEWLGHSDSKMVKHYFHLHDSEAQRQMKRLDFLGGSPGGVAGHGGGGDG